MVTIPDGDARGWVGYLPVTRNVPITLPQSSRVTTAGGYLWTQIAGLQGQERKVGFERGARRPRTSMPQKKKMKLTRRGRRQLNFAENGSSYTEGGAEDEAGPMPRANRRYCRRSSLREWWRWVPSLNGAGTGTVGGYGEWEHRWESSTSEEGCGLE